MGLFKKLQNGDTQLKSLKFGNDRPNGGSSNQPYVKKDIDEDSKNPSFYNDFIIRGGILAPISAAEDTSRLAKYFVDIQNPNGILFTVKQNLLSRTGTKTEASSGAGYGGGVLNEGVFTPLSTLGQSLVGFTGTHLNKQGVDPTGLIDNLSITTYQDAIIKNQVDAISIDGTYNNRLLTMLSSISNDTSLDLYGVKGYKFNSEAGTLLSYGGGAGSVVGFGKTKIKYATDSNKNPIITLQPIKPSLNIGRPSISTWNYSQFQNTAKNLQSETLEDFRESLLKSIESNPYLSSTPGYKDNNIENKFHLGNPGSRTRDRSKISNYLDPLDTINSSAIYSSKTSKYISGGDYDDIIQFSIAILDNEKDDSMKKYMHFRAFIDSFSDSYDADWKSISYMGRAEKLYKYGGFDRKISMGFTVAAQSKGEMNAMYEKLNFLASSLAPEYLDSSGTGYMAGNIAYITLGDYINDQPGIITSLTLDIPEDSSWEITSDIISKQLPFMIKVTLNFTPIHKFRPSKITSNQKYINNKENSKTIKALNGIGILPINPIPYSSPNATNILLSQNISLVPSGFIDFATSTIPQ